MFNQQSQDLYPTKSAIKNYLIESSLPAYVLNRKYNTKPLPKTHEFYKNDAFIWNNPYRTSQKSYKFYHQQQEEYKPIEERIKREEMQQRAKIQKDRLDFMKASRMEDRNRLMTRRSERTKLQNSVFKQSSQPTMYSYSSKNGCKQKTQLKDLQQIERGNSSDAIVQKIVRSVIMRDRQSRFQQLKDRRSQIQNLIRKSGQSLRMSAIRPVTTIRKPRVKMFKEA